MIQALTIIAWFLGSVWYSARRSFWTDELVRLEQFNAGLVEGMKRLFHEPSPFAPGEIVLNWLSGSTLNVLLPAEVWGRLPGLIFGALTISIAFKLSKRFFPYLILFSVSLWQLAPEMRPYGSLYYAGAAMLYITLTPKENETLSTKILTWFSILFTHIYGICFVAFACLITRRYFRAAFGFLYVAVIFSMFGRSVGWLDNSLGFDVSLLKQVLGTLGNPHTSSVFHFPLFMIGLYSIYRRNSVLLVKLLVLLGATVAGPIVVTVFSRYFFVPRQIAAGAPLYLYAVAEGIAFIFQMMKKPVHGQVFVALVAFFISIRPWVYGVAMNKPPFVNQPSHRFREIAASLSNSKYRKILLLDPCSAGAIQHYLRQKNVTVVHEQPFYKIESAVTRKITMNGDREIDVLADSDYCGKGPEALQPNGLGLFEKKNGFDLVIHSYREPFDSNGIEQMRTW